MESVHHHVGTPPASFSLWEIKLFHLHNFLELPNRRNDDVVTSAFRCFGHEWELQVYPGGDGASRGGDVQIYIINNSPENITVDWKIVVIKSNGEASKHSGECDNVKLHGYARVRFYFDRERLIEKPSTYLSDGTLTIRVQMKLSAQEYRNCILKQPYYIDNTDMIDDDETSDVAFDVKGTIIKAHKGILKAQAKEFYEMCEGNDTDNPMFIQDVNEDVFHIMLHSLYGGGVCPRDLQEHALSILKASSKYGFTRLKEEAEAWHAKSIQFTVDNAIDEFMKADGSNFPIVKDAAKTFILENGKEIISSESFARLYESVPLQKEVLAAAFENGNKRQRVG